MRLVLASAVIFLTLITDLCSKWLIEVHIMSPPRVIPVMPFFNLVLGYNRGVSFGLLSSDNSYAPYALSAFALVIVIVLFVALWRSNNILHTCGFAAIIGGALSNVVDRLYDGAVTDFLDFFIGQYHWPAFNFADTAIICGVVLLLIPYKPERPPIEKSGEPL